MKKLMIAVAAATMVGGAFASLCEEAAVTPGSTAKCWVWNFRANVRTLIPAKAPVVTPASGGSACADPIAGTSTNCVYLVAGQRQFSGIVWLCNSSCPAGDLATATGAQYVIWENSSKLPVTAPAVATVGPCSSDPNKQCTTWAATAWPAADGTTTLFDRFGLWATAAEMYYELTLPGFSLAGMTAAEAAQYASYATVFGGKLTLAGFGALPSELPAANFASINGYCVANWKPECGPTKRDFCSALTTWCAETDATNVAGYGVWSLTYNAAASSGNYSLGQIIPERSRQ